LLACFSGISGVDQQEYLERKRRWLLLAARSAKLAEDEMVPPPGAPGYRGLEAVQGRGLEVGAGLECAGDPATH
jgi:hypothetical protein